MKENQRSNCQYSLDHRKSNIIKKIASLTKLKPLTVWITTNCTKILKEMGVLDHHTCLLRNMFVDQESTVRSKHGTME